MKRAIMRVDVIVPVYRPDWRFVAQLSRLARQTVQPEKIIIMNTERGEWEKSGVEEALLRLGLAELCELHHLPKESFDHGGTRNAGVRFSTAPYFVMMTQDALPVNERLLENLLRPLGGRVKMSYGRQLPYPDADPIERFTRHYNYPGTDAVKSIEDLGRLGIKTYFASNVCAAYDRGSFDRLGGFPRRAIFNEDMIYAARLLRDGGSVFYAADALVRHSHRYGAGQQFRRNFDLAVSQAEHPEIFGGLKSEGEGIRMVRRTAAWLREKGRGSWIPRLFWLSGAKYLGYLCGKNYRFLPGSLVRKCTLNRSYWGEER